MTEMFGHVIHAIGKRHYLVCFDNSQEKELPYNVLNVESSVASIAPDMPLPDQENIHTVRSIVDTDDVQEA